MGFPVMTSGFLFGNRSATDSFDVIVMVEIAAQSLGNKSMSVVKLERYQG